MRSVSLALVAFASLATLAGCGEKKDAKDPSTDDKPATTDEPPKWEGAGAAAAPQDPKRPGSIVNEGGKTRTDQYDKEGTEIVLKRAARQVKDNCGAAKDDNGKAIGPWGKATLQVQLGHNGHSKGVTVPPPYQGKPVGNCVEKAFAGLTFPPWTGADTEVSWDIELIEPKK